MADYLPLKYGTYTYTQAILPPQFRPKAVARDQKGRAYLQQCGVTISSWLTGSTLSNLKTAISALETAHETDNLDLVLYDTNGSTKTDFDITSSSTLTGVRVVSRPYYSGGEPTSYVPNTRWPFTVEYEWTEELIDSADKDTTTNIIEFSESLSLAGGGARYIDTAGNPPVEGFSGRYRVVENVPYTAVQSGSVTVWHEPTNFRDMIPAPKWPENLMEATPLDIQGPQERYGTNYRRWTINYSYRFESPEVEMTGTPNTWPL